MNFKTLKPAKIIETTEDLQIMVSRLVNEPFIGVDTESNSLFVYEEKVCLIQFSSKDEDFLVDTIKLLDVSVLNELFTNPKIEKIFHAAEYDLMCLKRDFQFDFFNIFDTMVASKILGKKEVGLQSLLFEFFDVSVEKKYQRANWGKRPLSKEMLFYAQNDTHYLIELRTILNQKLAESNKCDLAKEDFIRLTHVDPFVNNKNNDQYWRIIKGNSLTPRQETILIELFFLRETIAKQLNRPPFKIFGNQVILDLAKNMPENKAQLSDIHGLSENIIHRFGNQILNSIDVGSKKTTIHRKEKKQPNFYFLHRYDALKYWRKMKAKELGVESDIVLPKEHMELIAFNKTCEMNEIQKIMGNIPYRFEKFGKEIYSVMEGVQNYEN